MLPPQDLKIISYTNMKLLVANVVSLIGACESKYALMGDSTDKLGEEGTHDSQLEQVPGESKDESKLSDPITGVSDIPDESKNPRGSKKKTQKKNKRKVKTEQQANLEDIALVKPRKEIEFGDTELLRHLLSRIAEPLSELQETIDRSVDVVTSSLVSVK